MRFSLQRRSDRALRVNGWTKLLTHNVRKLHDMLLLSSVIVGKGQYPSAVQSCRKPER